MFTAQGPSVLHAIEVAVVQFAQVHLVLLTLTACAHAEGYSSQFSLCGHPPILPPINGAQAL